MFSILLLGVAAAVGAPPIIVADSRPTISIGLDRYNLREEHDVRLVQQKIRNAANGVCVRGYGVEIYEERVACVKSAIADGNTQLDRIVAKDRPGSSLAATAAISISTK
jgi:UrcA family protein